MATFLLKNIKYTEAPQGKLEDIGIVPPIINNHSFLPAEDIEPLVETPPECHLIDASLPLHPILHYKLPFRLGIGEVESPQALRPWALGIMGLLDMSLLGTRWFLGRFEIHGADGAFPEVPVLDGRHAVDRGSEGSFEAGGLEEVPPASGWGLVGQLEICMEEGVLVLMRSRAGWWRMVGGNLELRWPFHSGSRRGVV